MPLDYYYLGDVKNVETQTCLDTMGRRTGENVGISYCHGLGGNQVCVYFGNKVIHVCVKWKLRDIVSILNNIHTYIHKYIYTYIHTLCYF